MHVERAESVGGCKCCFARLSEGANRQWRRQRSKGARSFQGQKIFQLGHPDAVFFLKKVDLFSCRPQNYRPPMGRAEPGRSQGGARAVNLLAKSFDLARSGVAPPLLTGLPQIP